MKTWSCWCVLAALVLLAGGCAWFEEPPPNGKKAAAETRGKDNKSRRSRRDPVDDMFFGIGKRNEAPTFATGGLNEDERAMVEKNLRRQDEDMKALRKGHRKFDEERDKRQEWVYGFKPRDLR